MITRVLAPPPERAVEPLAAAPTFSIVISAYQVADVIGRALRSALEQAHPAHEILVVDDGSTDDLDAALEPFAGRFTLIRKQNGGGASALNAAAAAAGGDFLAILDADDAYHPRRLAVLAGLATERPDLDLITTDARIVVHGDDVGRFGSFTEFAVSDQRTAIFESCFVGGWPAVRLSRLRSIGGFDEDIRVGYDWDCWLRLILDGARAGQVDEPYYDYHLHAGSLSADRLSTLWDRPRILEKANRNPALHPEERSALKRALRMHRTRAVFAETQAALAGDVPRGRLLSLAVTSGVRPRARVGAALAATVPPLARRLVPRDRPPETRLNADG